MRRFAPKGDDFVASLRSAPGWTGTPGRVRPERAPESTGIRTRFEKINKTYWTIEKCSPSPKILATLMDKGVWPGVRPLVEVASSPILRADGSIAQDPGYDAASGHLLAFDPAKLVSVPNEPTIDQAIFARNVLLGLVSDFPWEADADKSVWLALLLTLLARSAIEGPCPMWMGTANVPGAGKSRLIDLVAILVSGHVASRATQPTDDSEARKLITSVLMAGDDLLLLDNVEHPLGGGQIDALLTGERWKDRALGTNNIVDLPIRIVIAATGNNIALRGDTLRRVLPMRLDSPCERPEDRKGFKIETLLAHARQERGALVGHALTILRAWFVAGRPRSNSVRVWGSFEAWSSFIPHVLAWVGLPDPQETRKSLEQDDPARRAFVAVIEQWPKLQASRGRPNGLTIREALDSLYVAAQSRSCDDCWDDLRAALETLAPGRGGQSVDARNLGHVFRRAKRRVVGGRRLVESGQDTHAGVVRWTIA